MAFVSPANMGNEEPVSKVGDDYSVHKEKFDVYEPAHGIAFDGHIPTLPEYQYYARIKREAELGGYSGNGFVQSSFWFFFRNC